MAAVNRVLLLRCVLLASLRGETRARSVRHQCVWSRTYGAEPLKIQASGAHKAFTWISQSGV